MRSANLFDYVVKHKGEFRHAKELLQLETSEGQPTFFSMDLIYFKQKGVDINSILKLFAVKDASNKTLISRHGAIGLLQNGNFNFQRLVPYTELRDDTGNFLLQGSYLGLVVDHNIKKEHTEHLLQMRDETGRKVFNLSHIHHLSGITKPVDAEYVQAGLKFAKDRPNPAHDVLRAYSLGLPLKSLFFKDTKKPNGFLAFPTADHNGAFSTHGVTERYLELFKAYDIYFITVKKTDELIKARKKIPNIELYMLNGHGSTTDVSLGDNDPALKNYQQNESYRISTNSKAYARSLRELPKNAIIFVNACESAGPGEEKSLAEFLNEQSQRRVYAAKKSYEPKSMQITRSYPLHITIPLEGQDIARFLPKKF